MLHCNAPPSSGYQVCSWAHGTRWAPGTKCAHTEQLLLDLRLRNYYNVCLEHLGPDVTPKHLYLNTSLIQVLTLAKTCEETENIRTCEKNKGTFSQYLQCLIIILQFSQPSYHPPSILLFSQLSRQPANQPNIQPIPLASQPSLQPSSDPTIKLTILTTSQPYSYPAIYLNNYPAILPSKQPSYNNQPTILPSS
jgi:hypothetical protein